MYICVCVYFIGQCMILLHYLLGLCRILMSGLNDTDTVGWFVQCVSVSVCVCVYNIACICMGEKGEDRYL